MDPSTNPSGGFRMAVLVESGVALVAWVLAWLFAVPVRDLLPVDLRDAAGQLVVGVVATLPMLAMLFWLIRARQPAFRALRDQVQWLVHELFPAGNPLQLALVAVLAGVGEELLFRGVFQTALGEWTTPILGLILASLLFGLAHAVSRIYFVLATIIGAYLGGLMLVFQDLLAPMVAHSLYDFAALIYLARYATGTAVEDQSPPHER